MPLVYIPDSVYAPSHYQPQYPSPYQHQSYRPAPSPYGLPQQPQVHFGAPPPPPQLTESAYLDYHPYRHQAAYPLQQRASYPFDPAESHKQRLLAEYAQSLDQRYPSSHQPQHHHSLDVPSVSSAQQAKIDYLESQLRAEKAERKTLAERAERKAAAKEAAKQEREQVEQVNQLRLQYLQQQQQQRRTQDRRRVVYADAQATAAAPPRHRHVVDEDQLVAFIQAQHTRSQPQPRPRSQPAQQHPSAPSVDQLTQLLALAHRLEARHSPHPEPTPQPPRAPKVDTPTPTNVAYHYIPHPSAHSPLSASVSTAIAGPSSHATSSPLPPAPATAGPTPLARLRLLRSRLNILLSSSAPIAPAELEKLLAEADELESGGDEEVRKERRRLVRALEAELARGEEIAGSPVSAETAVGQEEDVGDEKVKVEVEGYAVPDLTAAEEAETEKEEEEEGVKEEAKVDKGKGRAVTVEDVPEEEQEEGYTVV